MKGIKFTIKSFYRDLYSSGWLSSMLSQKPKLNGSLIPWWPFSFMSFIDGKCQGLTIIELGGGHSTLWLSKRAKRVVTVESSYKWFRWLSSRQEHNTILIHNPRQFYEGSRKADILIIDGTEREQCMNRSESIINDTGVIVLDDSFREEYKASIDVLINKGWKRLDFFGKMPTGFHDSQTTIFYRQNNCLGI